MGRKNPSTSIDAYKQLTPEKLRKDYQGVINALAVIQIGNSEEIAKQMKVSSDKARKRLSELEGMGLIFKPGVKHKMKSGSMGFAYQLTELGKEKVSIVASITPGKTVSDYSKAFNQPALSNNTIERLF